MYCEWRGGVTEKMGRHQRALRDLPSIPSLILTDLSRLARKTSLTERLKEESSCNNLRKLQFKNLTNMEKNKTSALILMINIYWLEVVFDSHAGIYI